MSEFDDLLSGGDPFEDNDEFMDDPSALRFDALNKDITAELVMERLGDDSSQITSVALGMVRVAPNAIAVIATCDEVTELEWSAVTSSDRSKTGESLLELLLGLLPKLERLNITEVVLTESLVQAIIDHPAITQLEVTSVTDEDEQLKRIKSEKPELKVVDMLEDLGDELPKGRGPTQLLDLLRRGSDDAGDEEIEFESLPDEFDEDDEWN